MRVFKMILLVVLLVSSSMLYSASHGDSKLGKIVKEITKGKKAIGAKVKLIAPVIAENGAVIPIKFSVQSPMTANNYVKSVHLVVAGNPDPKAFSVKLTPAMGAAAFSTRIRMGKTSEVRAYAVMSNGKVYIDKKEVKVTIGGCG